MQNIQAQSERATLSRLFGLICARLLAPLSSLLMILLVARVWGETGMGQYMTVMAWLAVFQMFSIFGLSELASREIGKYPDGGMRYFTHALALSLIFSFICLGVMAVCAALSGYGDEVRSALMLGGLSLPSAVSIMICHSVFIAFGKVRYIGFATFVESLLLFLAGSLLVVSGYGLTAVIWSMAAVRMCALLINMFMVHRYIFNIRFRIDPGFLLKLAAPVMIFGLTGAFNQVFLRTDVIMLSMMSGMDTVGLFSSAKRLMEIFLMLPFSFYVLNLPVAAGAFKASAESAHLSLEIPTQGLLVIVFCLVGFGIFFAEPVLGLLYGQAYEAAGNVLRILMLVFLAQSFEVVLGMSCQAAGHHRIALYIVAARTVINMLLNVMLIPRWGMAGAASATLFSLLLSLLLFQYVAKKYLGGFRWLKVGLKPASVSVLTVLLLVPLSDYMGPVTASAIFFVLYTAILYAFGGISGGHLLGPGIGTKNNT